MGIGKHALLFLLRKKSKSVILLVILTVIATLVLICISIGSASDIAAQNLRETMGGYFKIEANLERETIQPVDDALVQKVMDSGGIKAYNGLSISYMLTDGLELVPGRFTAEGDYKAHLACFLSNTDTSLNEYFVLRSLSLKEGRHITPGDKNKALISDVLAQRNGLTIGDKFSSAIDSTDFPDEQKNAVKSITYEIVGIYQMTVPRIRGVEILLNATWAKISFSQILILCETQWVPSEGETLRHTPTEQLSMLKTPSNLIR